MTNVSIPPESLKKLVFRIENINSIPESVVTIEDADGGNQEYDFKPAQSNFSSVPVDSNLSAEDAHAVERYLLEAIRASHDEFDRKWERFVREIEKYHYTNAQIKKIIDNLDSRKQYSALHYAVWYNNVLLVEELIKEKSKYRSDINILSGYGQHVLHTIALSTAIWSPKEQSRPNQPVSTTISPKPSAASKSPVKRTTNIQVKPASRVTQRQDTPDNAQASTGVPEIVEKLMRLFKKRDYRDNDARTPLHLAVFHNRSAYVRRLLDTGADMMAQSTRKENVFHYVCLSSCSDDKDKDEMFNILLKRLGARTELLKQQNLEGQTPLTLAMCYGTPYMIETLFNTYSSNFKPNEMAVCTEMFAKRQLALPDATVELLLNHVRNHPSHTLLHIICQHDNPRLLERLLLSASDRRSLPELLERPDEHGYTPLLSAAYYGRQSMVKLLLEKGAKYRNVVTHEKKNLLHLIAERQHYHVLQSIGSQFKSEDFRELMSGQPFQATPLHEVCKTNNVDLCRLLLSKCLEIRSHLFRHQDAYGRTVFHEACDHGRQGMIEYLTSKELITDIKEKKYYLALGDDEQRTCLHLAAAKGHREIVAHLLQEDLVNVNAVTEQYETAFHYACINGHQPVVIELLAYGCDTLKRNGQLYNGLEMAIMSHNEDVVRLLVLESSEWRPMLRNAQRLTGSARNAFDTPVRKLIRYMPKLMAEVIDERFTRTNGSENMTVNQQIFDYEFFEDQLVVKEWYSEGLKADEVEDEDMLKCCYCFNYRTKYSPYTGDAYILVRNHPLFIASESEEETLMEHPFMRALRFKKYTLFGQYLLFLSSILYTLYLIAYTSIIVRMRHPQYYYALVNETSFENNLCESVVTRLISSNVTEVLKDTTYRNLKIGIYVFLVMFIVKNAILILSLFPRFFRKFSYYLEAAALVLAFVCVLDQYKWLDPVTIRCPTQYQIGAFGLLLSWLNSLIYLRVFPVFGIYVVMIEVISKKFSRFLPVLLILIVGFGLTYYALLQNQEVYSTPIYSLIKTSLIMFELNYDDRMFKPGDGGINYYPVTFVLFILTGYVMTVFVINLLIGLAVGEIPSLVKQGELLQSRIFFDTISDYELLRLQIRSVVLWLTSRLCYCSCCCRRQFQNDFYRWIDRSILRQRPILFQVRDRKRRGVFQRLKHLAEDRILNEQIQESIDKEEKEKHKQSMTNKATRTKDNRERQELAMKYSKQRKTASAHSKEISIQRPTPE